MSFVRSCNQTQLGRLPNNSLDTFDWERTPITALPDTIEASPWKKRLLTCLLAMYMPPEGIDENLGAALDCWNFYVDQPHVLAIPAASPRTETVKVVGVSTSPGMTFEG